MNTIDETFLLVPRLCLGTQGSSGSAAARVAAGRQSLPDRACPGRARARGEQCRSRSGFGEGNKNRIYFLFGVGLLTPPTAPTVGLLCGLWHGQEPGHSVIVACFDFAAEAATLSTNGDDHMQMKIALAAEVNTCPPCHSKKSIRSRSSPFWTTPSTCSCPTPIRPSGCR